MEIGVKIRKKNTLGYSFKFYNAPISRCSKKQHVVALFTHEFEYIACSLAACQTMRLASILKEFEIKVRKPMIPFLDNKFIID